MASHGSPACCSVSSLKVATIVLGSIGLVLWPTAIGFTCGYAFYGVNGYYPTPLGTTALAIILIGVNMAYIYLTSLIIFKLTGSRQMTPEVIQSVRRNTARLVAFLLIGFAAWVNSVVWYAMYGVNWDGWFVYVTLFGCSFSFVWTVVVAGVAGSLTHMYQPMYEQTPREPPKDYDPQGRFRREVPTRYEGHARETQFPTPKGNRGAPPDGHVSPWADHM
ncbi:uncharacterized protein LOC119579449 [Penaeus monodon]|uniref:uncharacterized protein LOC119579449 n=1 Tax=Penaeus monodon TaxID=6687 RepID=UPI0018A79BB6|nr:uncharacterized protein LOC119579449 [Penaeus monodon]